MNCEIDVETLRFLVKFGQDALDGDSNDAEHDALGMIMEFLEEIQSQVKRKSKKQEKK